MKISEKPLVSFITINFNNTQVTIDLLNSLKHLRYENFEIIVVDNASKVNPEKELKATYPEIVFIRSDQNLGFAGGNNLGISASKGELLYFVNNDTELPSDALQGLIDTFKEYPEVGVVSPKFHYFFHPGTIEYAGYESVNVFTGRNKMVGCREKDQGQYDQPSETNYAHGGGMMISREVIDKVGPMPEEYFLYYEEFDWCEKIKRHGFKIYYQPNSLIYHKESMTTGKHSVLKTYYLSRNRILFMRRNTSRWQLTLFLAYLVCLTIPKNVLSFLIKREMDHLKAFVKGISWNLTNKPAIT
ncbi:MAG: glycosyltransferase family 2 protein [Bacteroidota bacterium]